VRDSLGVRSWWWHVLAVWPWASYLISLPTTISSSVSWGHSWLRKSIAKTLVTECVLWRHYAKWFTWLTYLTLATTAGSDFSVFHYSLICPALATHVWHYSDCQPEYVIDTSLPHCYMAQAVCFRVTTIA
jgi:hypothetical protein